MNTTIRRAGIIPSVAIAIASTLLLTGCLEDTEEATPAPATTEDSAAVAETGPVTGQACLTGSWTIQNDTFEGALMKMLKDSPEVPADMKADMSITIDGESSLRFDGTDVYGAWQDALTMTMKSRGATITHVQDSSSHGNYGSNDKFVWVSGVEIIAIEATMSVNGMATVTLDSSSPGMASVDAFGWTGEVPGVNLDVTDGVAAYECTGDDLILIADGDLRTALSRIPGK